MIFSEKFIIGHMPKTGGDAAKQIISRLGLPGVTWVGTGSPQKHKPLSHVDHKGKDLILTFRRLPWQVISYTYHKLRYDGWRIPEGMSFGQFAFENQKAEQELRAHTAEDTLPIKNFIRSEELRSDLEALLSKYFPLTEHQREIIHKTPTKAKMPYSKNMALYFTPEQLKALYDACPLWSEYERIVYGSLLA